MEELVVELPTERKLPVAVDLIRNFSLPWTLNTAEPVPGVLKSITLLAFVPLGVNFKFGWESGTKHSISPVEWILSLSVPPVSNLIVSVSKEI